jgi:hypothetical protein
LHVSSQGVEIYIPLNGSSSVHKQTSWYRYPTSLFGVDTEVYICNEVDLDRIYITNSVQSAEYICNNFNANRTRITNSVNNMISINKNGVSSKAEIQN